tara:strand:+ start:14180 stop:14344 length:165 start_codon:yes stop_codon:yes gene_type:complete
MYGIKIDGLWLLESTYKPYVMYENPTQFKFETREEAQRYLEDVNVIGIVEEIKR